MITSYFKWLNLTVIHLLYIFSDEKIVSVSNLTNDDKPSVVHVVVTICKCIQFVTRSKYMRLLKYHHIINRMFLITYFNYNKFNSEYVKVCSRFTMLL